jgi:hypothetical protein
MSVRCVSTCQPEYLGRRAKPLYKVNKVAVLRKDCRRCSFGGAKDVSIFCIAQSQISNSFGVYTLCISQP